MAGDGEIVPESKSGNNEYPGRCGDHDPRHDGCKVQFANLALSAGGGAVFQFRQKKDERGATINIPGYATPCWLKLTRRYFGVLARRGCGSKFSRPCRAGSGRGGFAAMGEWPADPLARLQSERSGNEPAAGFIPINHWRRKPGQRAADGSDRAIDSGRRRKLEGGFRVGPRSRRGNFQ